MNLKEKILEYLIENETSVSGQKMADLFQVSRGAIWKSIQSLNAEGYEIEGKNNSGYFIHPVMNIISEKWLQKYLHQYLQNHRHHPYRSSQE